MDGGIHHLCILLGCWILKLDCIQDLSMSQHFCKKHYWSGSNSLSFVNVVSDTVIHSYKKSTNIITGSGHTNYNSVLLANLPTFYKIEGNREFINFPDLFTLLTMNWRMFLLLADKSKLVSCNFDLNFWKESVVDRALRRVQKKKKKKKIPTMVFCFSKFFVSSFTFWTLIHRERKRTTIILTEAPLYSVSEWESRQQTGMIPQSFYRLDMGSIHVQEKVNFKSQILVHKYWAILDHFGVPVLFASGCHQHVLKNVNITFLGNTGTAEMFQYLPILGRSSIWDLKYTFSHVHFNMPRYSSSGTRLLRTNGFRPKWLQNYRGLAICLLQSARSKVRQGMMGQELNLQEK